MIGAFCGVNERLCCCCIYHAHCHRQITVVMISIDVLTLQVVKLAHDLLGATVHKIESEAFDEDEFVAGLVGVFFSLVRLLPAF